MLIAVVLVCLSLVVVAMSGYLNGKGHKVEALLVAFMAGSIGFGAIKYANSVGIEASKVMGGSDYYEVIVTTSVPNSVGTLIYAVDLDENKGKTDVLTQYPIDGYKIEQVGKRTFLLPESTHVALDKEGEIVLISAGGEAINVPPIITSGK